MSVHQPVCCDGHQLSKTYSSTTKPYTSTARLYISTTKPNTSTTKPYTSITPYANSTKPYTSVTKPYTTTNPYITITNPYSTPQPMMSLGWDHEPAAPMRRLEEEMWTQPEGSGTDCKVNGSHLLKRSAVLQHDCINHGPSPRLGPKEKAQQSLPSPKIPVHEVHLITLGMMPQVSMPQLG
ncbi:hypothetical protein AAES_88608 [Amazona aestiva]|uniref:Uncharacterized protein n=1 Tax=Amazona aestiva TaxID=12930 RepID=A0A0Q3R640_AMAAE|nr:hypothetical protein AAES_88608 [Amazona aestiva]